MVCLVKLIFAAVKRFCIWWKKFCALQRLPYRMKRVEKLVCKCNLKRRCIGWTSKNLLTVGVTMGHNRNSKTKFVVTFLAIAQTLGKIDQYYRWYQSSLLCKIFAKYSTHSGFRRLCVCVCVCVSVTTFFFTA